MAFILAPKDIFFGFQFLFGQAKGTNVQPEDQEPVPRYLPERRPENVIDLSLQKGVWYEDGIHRRNHPPTFDSLQEKFEYSDFRGLKPPFEINFRSTFNRNEIDPICFAGLNGSGKSNMMELISEIFFYLEAVHMYSTSDAINPSSPFGFYIEYKIPITANSVL